MNQITRVVRLINTIRFIKPVQIYNRLLRNIRKPRVDLSPAPSIREIQNEFIRPCGRRQSLTANNTFNFLNCEHAVESESDWTDDSKSKLWLYNLHYFDFLRSGVRQEVGEHWVNRWIEENPPGQRIAWDPYTLSLRIVNWIYWDLSGYTLPEKARHALAVQMRYLSRCLEVHLQANHLLVNFKAIYFAATYFDDLKADQLRSIAARGLMREIDEQFLDDGGHFELSPMYHAILTEDLLDVLALQKCYPQVLSKREDLDLNERLEKRLPTLLRWLEEMIHPDGDYVLFNDGACGVAPQAKEILKFAERCNITPKPKRNPIAYQQKSGHARLECGPSTLFVDIGDVGASYQPGHAHADTLTFEWSLFGRRFVVDSGTMQYASGAIREHQRSTAAHNTVEVDHCNSSEVWNAFRVARRAVTFDVSITKEPTHFQVRASHNGYRQILKAGPVHTRYWCSNDNSLTIKDRLQGNFEVAMSRFHFHPDVSVRQTKPNQVLLSFGENEIVFIISHGKISVSDTTYSPEFGLAIPNKSITVTFHEEQLRQEFTW